MANMIKGEVTLKNGMTLVLSFNALCELEMATGEPATATLARVEGGTARFVDLRNIFFASLKQHQPDITLVEAGDIAGEYLEALLDLFRASFPNAEAVEPGNVPRPAKKTRA